MNINIYTKNISLDEPLKIFIEDKIGSLSKFIKGDAVSANVEIGKPSKHHRSGMIFRAEVNLKIGGQILRAESTDLDLRVAITEVKNELQRQIKKFKEKYADLSRKTKK
ncbi:MAG: ribosomal subunit interface protein [Candidatus Yanofskybacteria bacterium CG10_big_fil_rev_8_21_14_0_10_37_15]|uniref:Ribosomal subunit interface protein n=1 Tax=Candidatus Yanofskybacteria bacterium CG10_big_fil_rev_8_21_14_0_10_37_15 TaxID=1975097 RepID=A0A2H0R5N8_9BACT|nr:MAG: ribosomal subunit interface protein [Candidatus Yanofskybacteria bacterium CG10_big_fil_rev_8_21_14_0_10_37_15]